MRGAAEAFGKVVEIGGEYGQIPMCLKATKYTHMSRDGINAWGIHGSGKWLPCTMTIMEPMVQAGLPRAYIKTVREGIFIRSIQLTSVGIRARALLRAQVGKQLGNAVSDFEHFLERQAA